jgi:cystathionine gamma-synthase
LRGIKTLAVRVQRQNENALPSPNSCPQHAKVRGVYYPFVEGHPDRALAMEQCAEAVA